MDNIRFKIDHHQVRIVLRFMDEFLAERPCGETISLVYSILEIVAVRLRRREAERRLEYRLILPVYQALALRRLVMSAVERCEEGQVRNELRLLLGVIDPQTVKYTAIN